MAETMDAEHGGAHVQDSPASPPCSCCSYSSPPAAPPAPPTPSCSQPRPAKRRKTVHVTGNLEIIDPDGDSVLVVNRATFDGAAQLIDAKLAAIEAEDGAVGQAKREIAPVLYPGGESDQDTNMWSKQELIQLVDYCARKKDVDEVSLLMNRSMSSVYFAMSRILKEREEMETKKREGELGNGKEGDDNLKYGRGLCEAEQDGE